MLKSQQVAGIMTLKQRNKVKVRTTRNSRAQAEAHSIDAFLQATASQLKAGKASRDIFQRQNTVPNHQRTDEQSLKVVSQPKGVDIDIIKTYTYLTEDQPARVYVLDSGFDGSHPVSLHDQFSGLLY